MNKQFNIVDGAAHCRYWFWRVIHWLTRSGSSVLELGAYMSGSNAAKSGLGRICA